MKICTIAVIGAGRVGKMHAENLRFFVPDLQLTAIVDPLMDQPWAENLGVDLVTDSIDVILKSSIDAVLIATPSTTHTELVEQCIKAKKHILCEKPAGLDAQSILRLTHMAADAGVVFQVGFNRRYDGHFSRVKDVVLRGDIGHPHIVRITSRDPHAPSLAFVKNSGGLYMDFAIHDFDMARYVSGLEVVEVYSCGAVLIDQELVSLGDIDTAITTLRMENGALCVIDNSRQAVYGYDQRLEVFGSLGSIEADNCTKTTTTWRNRQGVHTDQPHHFFIERYKEAYIEELRDFYRCITKGQAPRSSGYDAAQAILIAKAAKQSLIEKRPVLVNS
jgi:myo-inositol 2-dehydrogenase / D-chiro-inositol 1-dehydrogenase